MEEETIKIMTVMMNPLSALSFLSPYFSLAPLSSTLFFTFFIVSHSVTHGGLELITSLLESLRCRDYKHEPPCPLPDFSFMQR